MTLYEAGKDAMEKEFRNLLARHGRPVPPGSLLDVLALEHGSHIYLYHCFCSLCCSLHFNHKLSRVQKV